MFKNLKAALISVLALTNPAFAEAPWERAAPQMSQAQRDGVAQIRKVLSQNSLEFPGRNPSELGFEFDYVQKAPIGNISSQSLSKLLDGNYFVYSVKGNTKDASDNIQMIYFQGGKAYACNNLSGLYTKTTTNKWQLKTKKWGSIRSFSGFGAYATNPTANGWGYPAIYDAESGSFNLIRYNPKAADNKKVWYHDVGHIQSDYALIFAQICPDLPKSGTINEAQVAMDYATFRKQAGNSVLRNAVPTIYRANVRAPVTLGMYYSAFPPSAQ